MKLVDVNQKAVDKTLAWFLIVNVTFVTVIYDGLHCVFVLKSNNILLQPIAY